MLNAREMEEGLQQAAIQIREFSAKFDKLIEYYEERIEAQFKLSDALKEQLEHAVMILNRVAPADERDLVALLNCAIDAYDAVRVDEQQRRSNILALIKRP